MSTELQQFDVVVVEDNDEEARLTLLGLQKIAPKPSAVVLEDGAVAIKRLVTEKTLRPKVVLLDLKLPKVHGLEVLAALKSDSDLANLPVLILSSSDHPSDRAKAREIGCAEYLCKPIDWEEYFKLVCCRIASYLGDSECGA